MCSVEICIFILIMDQSKITRWEETPRYFCILLGVFWSPNSSWFPSFESFHSFRKKMRKYKEICLVELVATLVLIPKFFIASFVWKLPLIQKENEKIWGDLFDRVSCNFEYQNRGLGPQILHRFLFLKASIYSERKWEDLFGRASCNFEYQNPELHRLTMDPSTLSWIFYS